MEENELKTNLPGSESDDDFVIGKGFNVNDYEDKVGKGAPKKRSRHGKGRGVVGGIVWIVAIIVVSVGIAAGLIFAGADYLGLGFGRGRDCVLEIPQGASTAVIAEKLEESGAVKLPLLFRAYSKFKHYDGNYKYGVYTFNTEAGYDVIANMLMTDGAKADSVSVTIPEMSTVDDIADLLEEKGVCTKKDFINEVQEGEFDYDFVKAIPSESVYYRLEGYLFPDTYDFYSYDSKECAHLAVDKMLKTLDEKLGSDLKAKMNSSKYGFNGIMTMASIVELEAGGSPSEMPNVAAVFYNRLESKDFATLGSSPTRKYPHGNGRYNTYECEGLPPGPLCSPSLNSLKAAIAPTESFDYYYFVTDASMNFYYRKTLAEHNAIIAKLKAEKNWIYED